MTNTTKKSLRPERGLTGLLRWNLPGFTSLSVIWSGPESPLYLVRDVPGGLMTDIMFEGYARRFATAKDAQKGFEEFLVRDGS